MYPNGGNTLPYSLDIRLAELKRLTILTGYRKEGSLLTADVSAT